MHVPIESTTSTSTVLKPQATFEPELIGWVFWIVSHLVLVEALGHCSHQVGTQVIVC
jgi:hypothetical protein